MTRIQPGNGMKKKAIFTASWDDGHGVQPGVAPSTVFRATTPVGAPSDHEDVVCGRCGEAVIVSRLRER
jgi:hypothetical protein